MFQMHFVPGLLRQAAALAYAPVGEVIPSDTGAFATVRAVVRDQGGVLRVRRDFRLK